MMFQLRPYIVNALTSLPSRRFPSISISCLLNKPNGISGSFCRGRRLFTTSQPNFDQNEQKRRKGLTILTYLSGFIGVCLLTAVGARQYKRFKYRARGIEELEIPGKRRKFFYKYRGYILPPFIINNVDDIHNFKVREDDIWVVSYPKAGTTWVQEIVYLIANDGNPDSSTDSTIDYRFPYFEFYYPGLIYIDKSPSPRFIKSHLPLSLLPNEVNEKKPKIIYIARNSKDTLVSFHSFLNKFLIEPGTDEPLFKGTLNELYEAFIVDTVDYGPWWKHVKEGWEKRDQENILFITYEDMKADLPSAIKKVAAFLNKNVNESQIKTIASHCSFEQMSKNKNVNYNWLRETGLAGKEGSFMRKGQVGDWKNHLTKEQAAKLDEIMKEKLEPLGLTFEDSLDDDQ